MANTKRKRRRESKRKCYNVPGLVVRGWGGFQTQSVRQVLKQSFARELDNAYGEW